MEQNMVLGFQYNIVYINAILDCDIQIDDNIHVTSNVTVVGNITISIMCILIVILVVGLTPIECFTFILLLI